MILLLGFLRTKINCIYYRTKRRLKSTWIEYFLIYNFFFFSLKKGIKKIKIKSTGKYLKKISQTTLIFSSTIRYF